MPSNKKPDSTKGSTKSTKVGYSETVHVYDVN